MRFDIETIWINGVQIFPSSAYYANLTGLKSFTKTNETSDLIGDGAYLGNSKIEPKTLTLTACTKKRYDIENDFLLSQLLSTKDILLNVKIKGFNSILEMYVNAESYSEDDFGTMTAVLKAYDPYLYVKDEKEVSLKARRHNDDFNFKTNNFNLAGSFNFKNEYVSGSKSEIMNKSYITLYPIIKVKGLCSNLTVTNETTGEILKVNYSVAEGDTLEIDCNPKTRGVYLYSADGKSKNLITYKVGKFISLVCGSNILSASYNGTADVLVKWKEKFN